MRHFIYLTLFVVLASCASGEKPYVLDDTTVKHEVKSRWNTLKSCTKDYKVTHGNLKGTLNVFWEIEPNGVVSEAKVLENTTGSKVLGHCFVTKIRRWKFHSISGSKNRQVRFPFQFSEDIE